MITIPTKDQALDKKYWRKSVRDSSLYCIFRVTKLTYIARIYEKDMREITSENHDQLLPVLIKYAIAGAEPYKGFKA